MRVHFGYGVVFYQKLVSEFGVVAAKINDFIYTTKFRADELTVTMYLVINDVRYRKLDKKHD